MYIFKCCEHKVWKTWAELTNESVTNKCRHLKWNENWYFVSLRAIIFMQESLCKPCWVWLWASGRFRGFRTKVQVSHNCKFLIFIIWWSHPVPHTTQCVYLFLFLFFFWFNPTSDGIYFRVKFRNLRRYNSLSTKIQIRCRLFKTNHLCPST